MKTHVLLVSQYFPKTHPRRGESTGFVEAIQNLFRTDKPTMKIHTIRSNYDWWKKRIDEVNAGEAILSIRYWTGKPYNSKHEEILRLTEAGIQKIEFEEMIMTAAPALITKRKGLMSVFKVKNGIQLSELSKNDGLSLDDFKAWFKGYDLSNPMAIIHFTNFKY